MLPRVVAKGVVPKATESVSSRLFRYGLGFFNIAAQTAAYVYMDKLTEKVYKSSEDELKNIHKLTR